MKREVRERVFAKYNEHCAYCGKVIAYNEMQVDHLIPLRQAENGKVEWDIVKFGDMVGIINYNTGCYCVKTNKPDWMSRNNPAVDIVLNEYPNEIEVIGNIHDNPELLKGGER